MDPQPSKAGVFWQTAKTDASNRSGPITSVALNSLESKANEEILKGQ